MALLDASITSGGQLTNELVRSSNAAAAPGRTGIDRPSDFLVRGLGSGGVSVDPGSGTIANTFAAAGFQQSYRVANDAADDDAVLSVPAAGSGSPRTDYVILRIYDTQYAGQTDPSGKGCAFVLVSSLPTGYPYMPLAKIVQPAGNTAGIQQSMVTNLRVMATSGVFLLALRPVPATEADTGMVLTSSSEPGETFPNGAGQALGKTVVDVPENCTRLIIKCTWLGVKCAAGKNAYGKRWVEWGDVTGTSTREKTIQRMSFNFPSASDATRQDWIVADDVYVPVKYRGTSVTLISKAMYTGSDTGVTMDSLSGMIWEVYGRTTADPEVR